MFEFSVRKSGIPRAIGVLFLLLTSLVSGGPVFASPPAADGPGGIDAVKAWARALVAEGEASFAATGARRHPSPGFWGDEVVYQIQVDRFNDGDPSNNGLDIEPFQRDNETRGQAGLPGYKHGGDLAGVIERLDYLQGLGVGTLWLTPVFKGNASYHGYCTSDFTRLDPTFGDLATLQRLSREAHARGMKVVLDIVVNHICDPKTRYDDVATPFQDWAYGLCVDDHAAKQWSGAGDVRGRRRLVFSQEFFPAFRHQAFFSRCGHKSGDFSGAGNGAVFGDFSDTMFDLDTQNWDFQDLLTSLMTYWIAAADVDGFRVDAAKHVTPDLIAVLSTRARAYAAGVGKANFLLVGEVAASTSEQALRLGKMRSNPWNPYDRTSPTPEALRARLATLKDTYLSHAAFALPGLNATYDFAHSGQAVEMWRRNAAPRDVKNWFWKGGETENSRCADEYCEVVAATDSRLQWNLLEIHDWPRFALHGEGRRQLIGAVQYLLATKGTPVLYYGVEQGLNGDCHWDTARLPDDNVRRDVLEGTCRDSSHMNHGRYRQDMFLSGPWRLGSVEPSVSALSGIGWRGNRPIDAASDPFLRTDHATFRSVRKAVAVRGSCAALRRGEIYFRAAHDDRRGGLLAFSRIDGGKEVLVLANTSTRGIAIDKLIVDGALNAGRPFARWKNLYNGFEFGTVGVEAGAAHLHFARVSPSTGAREPFVLAPESVALFVDESNIAPWDDRLGAHLCRE
jgi:glycosidase